MIAIAHTVRPLALAALMTLATALSLNATPGFAAPASQSVGTAQAAETQYSRVNINSAGVEALAQLHGIGKAKAQAIVDYRDKFGRFRSVDDLLAVDGVGKATLTKNRGRIDL